MPTIGQFRGINIAPGATEVAVRATGRTDKEVKPSLIVREVHRVY